MDEERTIKLTVNEIGMLLNLLSNVHHFIPRGCTDWAPELKRIQQKIYKQQ